MQQFTNDCCQRRVLRLALAVTAIAIGLVGAQQAPAAFTATGAMSHPRVGHTATLLPNGMVLVAGGQDDTTALSSAELYNPATGIWTATGPLASARFDHTATLLGNGLVLVAGGSTNGSVGQVGAELYDPASGSWIATGGLIAARAGHTATLLADGKVLIAGGYNDPGPGPISAELYDPVAGTCTQVGAMATPRAAHAATLLPNGQVLVANGGTAELYDPVTQVWTNAGFMNEGFWPSATLLPNGRVLVAGGATYGGFLSLVAEGTADLYDPAAGTWTQTGSMVFSNSTPGNAIGRFNHTATLLPNGLVLAAGGWGNFQSVQSTTEFYNPDTGTWSAGEEMTTGRAQHTATMLPNGQVLIAGGDAPVPPLNIGSTTTASAELYWTGTVAATRPTLTDARKLPNGSFQFGFTNTPGASFSARGLPTTAKAAAMALPGRSRAEQNSRLAAEKTSEP